MLCSRGTFRLPGYDPLSALTDILFVHKFDNQPSGLEDRLLGCSRIIRKKSPNLLAYTPKPKL